MREYSRAPNPFGSRFTKPGALPFLTSSGQPLAHGRLPLADRVAKQWRSAVVGPHGSGKTTLLAELLADLSERFPARVGRIQLVMGQSISPLWTALAGTPADGLFAIDGYEQIPALSRPSLLVAARRRRIRLLITAHPSRFDTAPLGFGALVRTRPSEEAARRLLEILLGDYPQERDAMRQAFDACWNENRENIRDLWARMYDAYEASCTTAQHRR